jgi:hypothetical protein
MEIKLNRITWGDCRVKWRFDDAFWKQVDNGLTEYAFRGSYGIYDCDGQVVGCSNGIPNCAKDTLHVITYRKASCYKYQGLIPGTGEYELVPCEGSGECKQRYTVCCVDTMYPTTKLVSTEASGGCYTIPLNQDDTCYPSCWSNK